MKNYLLLVCPDGSLKLVSESSISVHIPTEVIAVITVSVRHLSFSPDDLSFLANSFDSILKLNL